jgi:Tol biopolymer transport system component
VLYELLTGERAFSASSSAETLTTIVRDDPPRLAELAGTSPELARLLRRCLEKRPEDRFQSAHDLAFTLAGETVASTPGVTPSGESPLTAAPPLRRRPRLRAALAAAVVVFSLLAGALLGRYLVRSPAPTPVHATLSLSAGELDPLSLALAPDGRAIAFVLLGRGHPRLWVRSLVGEDEPRALTGTEGATYPFWSPDSRHLGFFAGGKLKRVPAAGGPVLTLAPAADGRGGTWSAGDVIVFAPVVRGGLQRVPATGGAPQALTRLATPTSTHRSPRFLPDGKHLLYVTGLDPGGRNGLYHLALDGGTSRRVLAEAVDAHFAHGRLLYYRDGSLVAQPFDPVAGELRGAAAVVAQDVDHYASRNQTALTASDRLLAYSPSRSRETVLTWFDGEGRQLGTLGEAGKWSLPNLSPDGTQAAVFRDPLGSKELWHVDLVDGAFRRIASGMTPDLLAWHPTGDELAVSRESAPARFELVVLSLRDGSQRILDRSPLGLQVAGGWSADDRIVYARGGDLWAVAADGKAPAGPLLSTPAVEAYPKLSPDGRWLAFSSDETGRPELYVAPFTALTERRQVSLNGCFSSGVWSEGGRALLFFDDGSFRIQRVAVEDRGGQTRFGAPAVVFERLVITDLEGLDFEPQGRRLLATTFVRKGPLPVRLVVDWATLLEQ